MTSNYRPLSTTRAYHRLTEMNVYTRSCVCCFPEDGGIWRIFSSPSCRLRGFFLCHNSDMEHLTIKLSWGQVCPLLLCSLPQPSPTYSTCSHPPPFSLQCKVAGNASWLASTWCLNHTKPSFGETYFLCLLFRWGRLCCCWICIYLHVADWDRKSW